jgi:DNA replication ATP-dependent helicase Dna2
MDVLNQLREAIEVDRVRNLAEFESEMSRPLDERVTKGVTMPNLKVEFEFYEGLPNRYCFSLPDSHKYIAAAKISCENNISKFKEGSSVVLSNGTYNFQMEIEEDSTERFILKPNDFNVKDCSINFSTYPTNNWEINNARIDIGTKLLLTNAHQLSSNNTSFIRVDNVLNGRTRNTYGSYSREVSHLNESQNAAYLKAINASDFCIIQGPPGTGKTETISNIAKQFVEAGLKVFITAPTHAAINNCINAIASKILDPGKVVKIGEKAQSKEVKDQALKKTRLSYGSYLMSPEFGMSGIVIGATPHSLCYPATKRLEGWSFDVAIIDEASQLNIPLAVSIISRISKCIFVGDHKQLDAIVPKDSNNEMFAESIFSRLARIYPNDISLLNTSYRLNKSLIDIPNKLFYNGLLHSDSSVREDDMEYHCTYHSSILNSNAHTLILHNEFDAKGRSPHEANLVAELVFDLLQNGIKLKEIGIMSPYRAQVREIKKQVDKLIPKSFGYSYSELFVDTVDSMQGQERNFIIYSLANSHPLESMTRLDFFYSPNRLNVAITRAIKKCIVIANYKIFDFKDEELMHHEEYQSLKSSFDIFKQYFTFSEKVELIKSDNGDAW